MIDLWSLVVVIAGSFLLATICGELSSGGTIQDYSKDFEKKKTLPFLCRRGLHKMVRHPYDRSEERNHQICLRPGCGLLRMDLSISDWNHYINLRYEKNPQKLVESWHAYQ